MVRIETRGRPRKKEYGEICTEILKQLIEKGYDKKAFLAVQIDLYPYCNKPQAFYSRLRYSFDFEDLKTAVAKAGRRVSMFYHHGRVTVKTTKRLK